MARENINVGAAANDGTGDTIRAAFIKTNSNFLELYTGNFLAAGSAAAPSLSFAADTNTGIFSPEADTLAFSTGGVNRAQITAGGNVGIGTTSPSERLDVIGNIRGTRFIGYGAGGIASNSAVGVSALFSNTTGNNNTANGLQALFSNTTGVQNTANGVSALQSNTTGNNNTANGVSALFSNTTGVQNTANGVSALQLNTTGNNNTANGLSALQSNTTGNNNTANGVSALRSNTTGVNNTANGVSALFSNTTGNSNTTLGFQSGFDITTGNNNVILGFQSTGGSSITTGSNNILLGTDVSAGLTQTGSNQLNIGNLIFGTGLASGATLSTGNVGIGTTSPAMPLHVSAGDRSVSRVRIQNTAVGGGAFDLVAGVDSLTQAGWSVFDAVAALTRLKISSAGAVSPGVDNTQTLGEASWRWSEIFCGNPIINTSDARDKVWRGNLIEAELRAAARIAREIGVFQWNDAIETKGADKARLHVGVRAQAVWAIMTDEGLVDPIGKNGKPGKTPYAFLCYDTWEEQREPVYEEETFPEVLNDEGNVILPARSERRITEETRVTLEAGDRFGLRLEQLSLFISAAQEQRLMALEAKL